MKDIIKKSFLLGLGVASMTSKQAEKAVKGLVKKNAVTINEGRQMLGKVRKHAERESKRVSRFAQQEAKRVAKELGFVSKAQIGRVKKMLKSVEKDLTSKGRITAKKILRDLSR